MKGMKTQYSFENNGDIYQHRWDGSQWDEVYIGRIDTEGDIDLEAEYAYLIRDVNESLVDTLQMCLPDGMLAGQLTWTPGECHLLAAGVRDRYEWDSDSDNWVPT